MTIKYILAVALITPFLTVSSMAQQYSGGPKSNFAPTRQIGNGADIYAQGVGGEIYAQRVGGDIYGRGVNTNKSTLIAVARRLSFRTAIERTSAWRAGTLDRRRPDPVGAHNAAVRL
jgi:hypothetical protein